MYILESNMKRRIQESNQKWRTKKLRRLVHMDYIVTLLDAEETLYISMTDPDGTLDDYCVHY